MLLPSAADVNESKHKFAGENNLSGFYLRKIKKIDQNCDLRRKARKSRKKKKWIKMFDGTWGVAEVWVDRLLLFFWFLSLVFLVSLIIVLNCNYGPVGAEQIVRFYGYSMRPILWKAEKSKYRTCGYVTRNWRRRVSGRPQSAIGGFLFRLKKWKQRLLWANIA